MIRPRGPVLGVIQARMGSTRLPGKVLMDLGGRPVLRHVIDRVRACRLIDRVVVATTMDQEDDAVEACCADAYDVPCVRFSRRLANGRNDVLARFHHVAQIHAGYRAIVRVTADCPLWCPLLGEEVIEQFHLTEAALASNVCPDVDGFDTEVFDTYALARAMKQATDPADREHVTRWLYAHCRWVYVDHLRKVGGLKLSLDTAEDLAAIRAVRVAALPLQRTPPTWSLVKAAAQGVPGAQMAARRTQAEDSSPSTI